MPTTRTSPAEDPKPELSKAAILANIGYCQAQQDYHLTLVKQFEEKELEYVQALVDLNRSR